MWRAWRWVIVGGVAVLVLAGCGRGWFAEREPWRRDAEEACLKSGAIKEGPSFTMLKPISGPGVCGADYPIKVSALGESFAAGYADELRPPGSIPGASPPRGYPANTPFSVNSDYPADTRLPPRNGAGTVHRAPLAPPASGEGPMPLTPSGVAPPDYTASGGYPRPVPSHGAAAPDYDAPRRVQTQRIHQGVPVAPAPAAVTARRDYDVAPLAAPQTRPGTPMPAPGVPLSPSRTVTGSIGPATVTPHATLACPIVSALDRWIVDAVQPMALRWFAQPVVEIRQISAYSCRDMNNGSANPKISEHAFGNALDIAAFKLADGHVITVKGGWRGTPEEQGFLHDVQLAACEQFTTVLAPGSNVFHYDHIHVDLMRRASRRNICQPAAIPGEVVAAKARARYAGRKGEPVHTGSISSYMPRPQSRRALQGAIREDDEDGRRLPSAVPGED
jgi:hypothetical protein